MNEKILELANEATRKYDRLGFEIPFAQPDLEDFANLIIQECINSVREDKLPVWSEPGEEREAIIENIKYRFGMIK